MKAANSRDFGALASLYTEDAVLLPANAETVRGRSEIKEFFEGFPMFSDMQGTPVEIEGRGDVAYVWGTYSMKIDLPGASEPLNDRGKYIEIWRKQADGNWSIARDIYNSDLPIPE